MLPAEWHPQRCVQISWPDERTDWAPYIGETRATMVAIAEAITRYEDLVIATRDARKTLDDLRRLPQWQLRRVTLVECDINDTWARDYGGITLIAVEGDATPQILDFRFNGWGEKFPSSDDNRVTRRLHESGALAGRLVSSDDFVLEGGSIESDGRGTVFTTSQCLLAPNRNQPMSRDEIEQELKRRLCAERIVWLSHGHLIGDDTDGHIDTIVRVAPDDTLLYVKSDDPDDEQHADLEALETELRGLRTADGQPYTLLPLPMPRPCTYDGERLPATYANFLVINGAVLVPTYRQADLDKLACDIIGKAFPHRDIIAIDATVIIRQHGSIHCLTMQYPDSGQR